MRRAVIFPIPLSTSVAEVLAIVLTLLIGWPIPLIPSQILWLNVVTSGFSDIALVFEPGSQDLYDRPPRPPKEGLLDRALVERTILMSVWFTVCTLGVFWWQHIHLGQSSAQARVVVLTTLVLLQTFHVFNCRSEHVSVIKTNLFSNPWMILPLVMAALHVAAMYFEPTQKLLSLQPLEWPTWGLMLPVGASTIVINEVHKAFCRRRLKNFEDRGA